MNKSRSGYKRVKWLFGKEIEIPEEWIFESLQSKINILPGFAFSSKNFDKERGFPLIRIRDLVNMDTETRYYGDFPKVFLINTGDLLVGMDGEFRPYLWKGKPGLLNQRVCKITTTDNEVLDRSFIFYAIAKPLFYYELLNIGTTVIHISKTDIEKITIPIPLIKEQQKIASILSGVDALIESTQKVIEKTERFKKGLMQNLLTRGIGHTKYKKVLIKYHFLELEIPKRWQIKSIKELSTLKKNAVMTGPFGLMLHSSDYVDEGIPLILIKNLKNGKLDEKDIPKISEKDAKRLYKYQVRAGDIVFSRVGRVGSASLIEKEHDGWLISGQMLRIRFENSNLNPYFVNYFIHSRLFVRALTPELLGSTRDSINTTILENLLIVIPSIHEQEKIASILSEVDAYIQKNQQYKEKLEKLKKGLMQKLLTGQVRVKV